MAGDRINKKSDEYQKKLVAGEIWDPEAARDISPNAWARIAKKLKEQGFQTIPFESILERVEARTAPIKAKMDRRLEDALVAADLQVAIQARSGLLRAKLQEGTARNKAQQDAWLLRLQSGDLTAWGEPPAGGGLQARWVDAAIEVSERALKLPEGTLAGKSYAELIVWLGKNVSPYQKIQECLGDATHSYFWASERQRLHREGALLEAEVKALKELQDEARKLRTVPPEPLMSLLENYQLEADDRAALKQMQRNGEYSLVAHTGWSQFTQIIELPFGEKLERTIWFDYWLPTKPSIEGNLQDILKLSQSTSRPDRINLKIKREKVYLSTAVRDLERILERLYPNMPRTSDIFEEQKRKDRRASFPLCYF